MKITFNLLFASILCLFIASCSAPAVDLVQAKADIQAMENAYAAATKAKNADAVVAYYADDAVNMLNNQPSVVGKAAILARIKADMAKDTTGSVPVFTVEDVMAAGNLVIEVGKSTATDAMGKVTTGKYISIFEKRDGKYVCIRDIWNDDAPMEKM